MSGPFDGEYWEVGPEGSPQTPETFWRTFLGEFEEDLTEVDCSQCGQAHRNGPNVSLPMCSDCFDQFIGGL